MNMRVFGRDRIQPELEKEGFFVKGLLNQEAIALFPAKAGGREVQHRDAKIGGLSYEDHYRGNALALVVKPGVIEIRFHDRFSDDRIREIVREVKALPELAFARDYQVTYQGRVIDPGRRG